MLTDDEMNLLDYLIVILKRKKLILKMTFGISLVVGIIVFIMPNKYAAQTRFLPPQDISSSIAASALSQFSGLSGGAAGSLLGIKSPGSVYIGMLTSRTVLDKIIDRFGLMERYKTWMSRIFRFYREDCRKKLTDDVVTAESDDTSGIVTVTVEENDPKIAADMANAFVEEMKELSKRLANSEASQRRLFYEDQLMKTKENLSKAEEAMRDFQEKTGVLQVDAQSQAVIQGDAALRAQIAAKEVEIKVMKTFSTTQNPDLQRAEEALRVMKAHLSRLEVKSGDGADPLMPIGRMPSVGVEYVRRLRDVKFNETLYETLIKMYELAKMDEVRDAAIIQVVDRAVVPEKKAKPKRLLIIMISVVAGFFLSVFTAFIIEFKEKAVAHSGNSERLELLRRYAKCWKRKQKSRS